ncbi:MAG: lycopene cyclase family protein [Amnibacterium sp.]
MDDGAPVPPALLAPVDARMLADGSAVVVLGAGCSGLAVAQELTRRGCTRPIVLVDRRTTYRNDRTWSFWSDEREPLARLATAAWHEWAVETPGTSVRRRVRGVAYRRIRAVDAYRAALAELAAAPGVHLRLGERVTGLEARDDGPPVVLTTAGRIVPGVLVDCRGPRFDAAAVADARREGVWLAQEFLGRRIRAARPVFDSSTATLLDFRLPQEDGVRFAYVLPVSPSEALVESVRLTPEPRIDQGAHRRLIAGHLEQVHGLTADEVTVVDEERGLIPMTDAAARPVRGPRHYALGLAGGAARPSTGYALLRTRRSAAELASAIVAGREPSLALDGARRRLLDAVFLRFLLRRPDEVPAVFARMFARTPAAALLRFLGDTSTLADEALLVAALPKAPFLAILAGLPLERLRRVVGPVRPVPHVVPRRLG